ncbi:MAG: carbohydrate-binding family 9-like protein [Verrucomicrobiota bacterium]
MKSYSLSRQDPAADGRPDWNAVTPLTDFIFPWTDREPPATTFHACLLDDDFHFRFDVEDKDIVLGNSPNNDDNVLGSDRAEIFFAADPDLNEYYCFEIDPRGLVFECRMQHYRKMDDSWSCPGLEVVAFLTSNGYQIDGQLPLQTLRDLKVLKSSSPEIIAGVYRAEFSHEGEYEIAEDWISWIDPETDTPDFHVPASFGRFILPQ